jgi:hypothetical protein
VETFGKISIGANASAQGGDFLMANPRTLLANGTLASMTAYLDATSVFTQKIRTVIYSDNAGVPNTFIGVSVEEIIGPNQAASWVEFAFSTPIDLVSATYWIGLWFGQSGGAASYYQDSGGTLKWRTGATYSSTGNPPDPFGAASDADHDVSLYAAGLTSGETISIGFRAGGPAGPY